MRRTGTKETRPVAGYQVLVNGGLPFGDLFPADKKAEATAFSKKVREEHPNWFVRLVPFREPKPLRATDFSLNYFDKYHTKGA